jgi:hypothetical protein
MSDLVVKPYHSAAFGDEFAVVPLEVLSRLGLEEARIVLDREGVRPGSVMRFKTRAAAEAYVIRRGRP